MEISYIKDGNRNTMIIQDVKIDENDYKLQMIMNNHIDGLLPIRVEQINNQSLLYYDITSKTQLSTMYNRKHMTGKELYIFIKNISNLAEKMSEYLLDLGNLILDSDCIFFNRQNGKYEFAYVTEKVEDFHISIRELYDKMLEFVDHDDKEAVMIAYGIQQLTISGDFTIQDILQCAIENMKQLSEEEKKKEEVKIEPVKIEAVHKTEEKKSIINLITSLLKKKDKYKTMDDLKKEIEEESLYDDIDDEMVIAESSEEYIRDNDATMLLINPGMAASVNLTALGCEIPIKINPVSFPYIIGKSSKSCDFCIDSAVISRVHMRITEELDDFYIEDLNSTNGTFLNGEKLSPHEPKPITAGDKITMANIDFLVE